MHDAGKSYIWGVRLSKPFMPTPVRLSMCNSLTSCNQCQVVDRRYCMGGLAGGKTNAKLHHALGKVARE